MPFKCFAGQVPARTDLPLVWYHPLCKSADAFGRFLSAPFHVASLRGTPPRALPDLQPPPLEVDWSVAAALPATALPARVAVLGEQPIEAAVVDTTLPKPRSKPVLIRTGRLRRARTTEAEEYHDYDSGERQRRRAFLERERVARRKVLTKFAAVAVLAIVTLFMVRAAINHINDVAEHNATIRSGR